jgi:hypothetical protein
LATSGSVPVELVGLKKASSPSPIMVDARKLTRTRGEDSFRPSVGHYHGRGHNVTCCPVTPSGASARLRFMQSTLRNLGRVTIL